MTGVAPNRIAAAHAALRLLVLDMSGLRFSEMARRRSVLRA
jgi:hypothetical protein